MCIAKQIFVCNQLSLGSRVLGVECYVLPRGEVVEYTHKQLRDIINQGKDEVYGLKLSEDGKELVFDDLFFTTNMMNKIHINTLVPMIESECLVNLFYIVIGTKKVKNETMYEVISSRFERTFFNGEKLKTLLEMGVISGGAKLEKGEIVVASLTKEKSVVNIEEA